MKTVKYFLKKNDKVRIITGRDKGKVGKILRFSSKGRVVIENINIVKRHTKPSAGNKQGGIIEKEAPIHFSNVMLMCSHCVKPIRPKIKILDSKKVRVCRNCNEIING